MKSKIKNFKIGKKLFVAFGTIVIFFIITIIAAITGLKLSGGNFTSFYDKGYQITNKAMELRMNIQTACKFIGYSTMENDLEKTKEYVDSANNSLESVRDGIDFMYERFEGDHELIDSCLAELEAGKEYREQIFEYVVKNENDKAAEVFFQTYNPHLLRAQEYLVQISEEAGKDANSDYQKSKNIEMILTIILIAIAGITLFITVIFAIYITRSITAPIKEIENAANKMLEGDLDVQITYESQDELGIMSDTLRKFMGNLRTIIQDESYLLKEMAGGNFKIKSKAQEMYVGAFQVLLLSMRQINVNLSDALNRINDASGQVAEGSDQVAQGAQDLANGATEQASSIQELLATINEVSGQIDKNAQNARLASGKTKDSTQDVILCNKEMENMTKAMETITEKTSKINNIIKSIEEIASQTNLLSLNASIEAARAGEAGKGFAVVANEIGQLAEASGKAVQNTTVLINETVDAVSSGRKIAGATAESLLHIVEGVESVTTLVNQIAVESENQSNAISEISEGVNQISSVVQTNSATAEESAASSEELSAQSQNMKELISRFQLREI